MAQHVILAAQLVPQYKSIERCNNYAVLQSIPCSPECKIVRQILLDHPLSYALTATADVPAVYLQQFWRTVSKKKEAIQYPCFIKLIIANLMKKFPNIPQRLKEDYHSIKDDVPLVSVYTTRNVSVRGMLIPDAFLTAEIRETNNFKEYETVFIKVEVLMNQPQPVVSTHGMHKITPRAPRSPTISASPLETKKRKQNAGESSSPRKSRKELTDTISIPTTTTSKHSHVKKRISSKYSHLPAALRRMCRRQIYMIQDMEQKCVTTGKLWETHNKVDQVLKEVVSEIAENAVNHLIENNLKTCIAATIIEDHDAFRSAIPAFVSQEFKTHTPKIVTELFKEYVQSNVIHVHPTTISSTTPDSSADLQYQLYLKMKHNLQDRADNITLWEALRHDDAPPKGEKKVKRRKESKRSKSARGSSSKHLSKESTKYNVDKCVPTIFDRARMEATLRDSLSNLSRNAKEYAYHLEQSTSFMENQIVWESRQQDIPRTIPKTLIFYGPQRNPNEPPRPLYNKDLFFLKYGNTEEKKYILSLHKIHAEEFPKPDLEEKITEVVRIVTDQLYGLDYMEQILVMRANDKPDSFSEADFKYLNKNDIEDLYYLCQSKEIDNRKIKLMNSLITFIRSHVIWDRVYDFQLGIESYQMKVNLTAPTLTFPGIKEHTLYIIVDEPQMGLIYLNSKDEKRVMYLEEIVKFCDATLERF
ncbi:hypothetical protein Tco_0817603 [Tanacetum coccineum]